MFQKATALTLLLSMVNMVGMSQAQNRTSSRRAAPLQLFVATNGSDAWSGRLARPNRQKSDGPFASLERARDEIRRLKAGGTSGGATVLVRGGTYFMAAPFVLEAQDSGTEAVPIIYAAYPNEQPMFSGGRRIGGWRKIGNRWETTLPDVQNGAWSFSQLFVDGERRNRPRLPRQGYSFIAGEAEPSPQAAGKGFDGFQFGPGDIRADWHNLGDVEVLAIHIWAMSRMRPANVDEANRIVTFTGTTSGTSDWARFRKGNRYIVENVREALDEPGEWYLDRPAGTLSYLPRPGEDPRRTVVIAPRLEKLIELRGDVAKRDWVQHIVFRGLSFAHSNFVLAPQGQSTPQAESNLSAAISAAGARFCLWENCRLSQVGAFGVELGAGCKNNRLENCELTDMAAGGIKIGEMRYAEDDEEVAAHNVVRNCLIAHGGRMHPAAVGVWIGHSPYNVIEHNDIHDFYYTGISPGWSWGYGRSHAHHNTLAYNHISLIGQGVLSDMGGIYTLGVTPGTTVHHNLIHDVQSFDYGGWGIYFDEGTTDIVAENNVVYRTKSAGFHQHYGKNNLVRNNVFAFGGEAQLMRTRPEEHLSFDLERNIVLFKDAPLLGSNWSGDTSKFKLDYNLYWNTKGQPISFAGNTLEQWQAKGQDQHSLIADPLFVDVARDDYRLRPNSPAFKLGFQPIDLSSVGRQGARYVPDMRRFPRAFPGPPPPPPPLPLAENFENISVGNKALEAATLEENEQARARVSEETAASGKRSLKFSDAAGQKNSFSPHIFYAPKFNQGRIAGGFDLRWESGAVFYHEWRDSANPYKVGPSLRVDADGTLKASGQTLLQMPPGQWVRFDIVCGLGDDAKGRYDLTVRRPGAAPQAFRALPCDPNFRSLQWFGFVSDTNGPSVFYLDNIEVKPR